jgi:hypothetical protein
MPSAVILAATTALVVSIAATQALATPSSVSRTGATALNPIEPVDCRRYTHTHRGQAPGRGCGLVRRDRGIIAREGLRVPGENISSPLLTIQSGTQPLGSGQPTGVESLRGGPDSNSPSGVPPLSGRSTTGSGATTPLSSSPGGSLGGSSSGSSSGGSSSGGSSGGSN